MAAPIKFSSDDHTILVNGEPVDQWIKGRCQKTLGGNVSNIEIGEGMGGVNVPPSAKNKPGAGQFSLRGTSADILRLAELSGEEFVRVVFRVVKNKSAYSYSEVGLTHAILGEVPVGPDAEAPEIEVSFTGVGYFINPRAE